MIIGTQRFDCAVSQIAHIAQYGGPQLVVALENMEIAFLRLSTCSVEKRIDFRQYGPARPPDMCPLVPLLFSVFENLVIGAVWDGTMFMVDVTEEENIWVFHRPQGLRRIMLKKRDNDPEVLEYGPIGGSVRRTEECTAIAVVYHDGQLYTIASDFLGNLEFWM